MSIAANPRETAWSAYVRSCANGDQGGLASLYDESSRYVYGLALLIAGFRTRRRDLRLAAIAIIALATLKVFLLDLAGLEGLWRAASFIALGFSLMGIAYLYRLLMPPGAERESGPEADESLR